MELIYYAAMAFTLFCLIALILMAILMRPSRVETRLLELVQTDRVDKRRVGGKERFEGGILRVVSRLKVMVGISEDAAVRARLASAGIGTSEGAGLYSAARLLSPLAGVLVASFLPMNVTTSILIGAGLGYLAPDLWLRSKIKRRRERIRRGVPDAVDLLVICMDAGLGLDQALLRVGQELGVTHPDINQEFTQLTLEQRAGKPRMEAWRSMADRTQLDDVASFVNMLVQTDRFGTPILAALNRLACDIRLKRRQHAEEMAAKTKIKILFPLVLFIFPCIFIVLLAPALLNIAKTLGSLAK